MTLTFPVVIQRRSFLPVVPTGPEGVAVLVVGDRMFKSGADEDLVVEEGRDCVADRMWEGRNFRRWGRFVEAQDFDVGQALVAPDQDNAGSGFKKVIDVIAYFELHLLVNYISLMLAKVS